MNIDELVKESYETAKSKGWHDGPPGDVAVKLCLIHSEVSEALEQYRDGHPLDHTYYDCNGKPEGFMSEIADVVIRIADLCGRYDLDLEAALKEKMAFNKKRSFRHGNKVC